MHALCFCLLFLPRQLRVGNRNCGSETQGVREGPAQKRMEEPEPLDCLPRYQAFHLLLECELKYTGTIIVSPSRHPPDGWYAMSLIPETGGASEEMIEVA